MMVDNHHQQYCYIYDQLANPTKITYLIIQNVLLEKCNYNFCIQVATNILFACVYYKYIDFDSLNGRGFNLVRLVSWIALNASS